MQCKSHKNLCPNADEYYVLSCLNEDMLCYHHYDIEDGRKMMICKSFVSITTQKQASTSTTSTTTTTHSPISTMATIEEPTTVVLNSNEQTTTTTTPISTTTQGPNLRVPINTSSATQTEKRYVLNQMNTTNLLASPQTKTEYIYVDNHSDFAIWTCIAILVILQMYQLLKEKKCRKPTKIKDVKDVKERFHRNSWSTKPPVQHMRREQKRRIERSQRLKDLIIPKTEIEVKSEEPAQPPPPNRPPPLPKKPDDSQNGLKTINSLRGTARLKQQMMKLNESHKS